MQHRDMLSRYHFQGSDTHQSLKSELSESLSNFSLLIPQGTNGFCRLRFQSHKGVRHCVSRYTCMSHGPNSATGREQDEIEKLHTPRTKRPSPRESQTTLQIQPIALVSREFTHTKLCWVFKHMEMKAVACICGAHLQRGSLSA